MVREGGCWGLKLGPKAATGCGLLGMGKRGSHTSLTFLTQMTNGPGPGGRTWQGVSVVMGRPERCPILEPGCTGLSSSLKPHTVSRGKMGGQWKLELALQGASSGIH